MEGDKWRPASDPRDPGPRVRQGSDAAAQAPVERLQIVPDTLVVRVLGLSLGQILEGAAEIAAHQVRVAAIVEEFGARARQPQRVGVGAVRETEALQLVVGGRKPEPRLGIALRALHGAPEVHLGETVVLGSIMLLAERQVVLRVAGRARGGRRRPAPPRRRGGAGRAPRVGGGGGGGGGEGGRGGGGGAAATRLGARRGGG